MSGQTRYQDIVRQIRELRWEKLSQTELMILMILAGYAALEFAESLRIALEYFPKHAGLKKMAKEELETDNLQFGDYVKRGDHAAFLWHFIGNSTELYPEAVRAGQAYLERVQTLPPEMRIMSIVSRERELPGIFERILEAKDWSPPQLAAFRYFLETHIQLDSKGGGHADMLADIGVTEAVAVFYRARLEMYLCIPSLFS